MEHFITALHDSDPEFWLALDQGVHQPLPDWLGAVLFFSCLIALAFMVARSIVIRSQQS